MIIVGGGAWGLSTALHLKLAGYSDITVFDRGAEIPSRYSAAWDLNKIVRAEYEDAFYTDLALVILFFVHLRYHQPRLVFNLTHNYSRIKLCKLDPRLT
jgi:glycine/D-amino acid oxidase-like deaminating enzyme